MIINKWIESGDYAYLTANETDFITLQLPSGLFEKISCRMLREKSEYFHSILTPITDEEGPSSWKKSSGRDITLENISDDAFNQMMKFLKGMKPKITEKNCLELLELAHCYQINELNRMATVPCHNHS